MVEATRSEQGRRVDKILRDDEANFMDLQRSVAWFNYEYPQVNPTPENIVATERSSLVKLYFPLRHQDSLTFDEAQWYWRTHHGPVIRRQAQGSGILRYQQVHRDEPELTASINSSRGSEIEPYMGHAEVCLIALLWETQLQKIKSHHGVPMMTNPNSLILLGLRCS